MNEYNFIKVDIIQHLLLFSVIVFKPKKNFRCMALV